MLYRCVAKWEINGERWETGETVPYSVYGPRWLNLRVLTLGGLVTLLYSRDIFHALQVMESTMISSFLKSRLLPKYLAWLSSPATRPKMARMRSNDPLVFIDCEMTGLDPEKETIMSIACFITDGQLKLQDDQGWESIIHHDKSTLERMDEWCTRTHGASGLTAACIASTTTQEQAAEDLLEYVKKHVPEGRRGLHHSCRTILKT